MNSWIVAGVLCVVFAAAEGLLAGGNPGAFLKSLRQPSWALPLWAWYLVGVVYYVACFFTAQSLWQIGRNGPFPWVLFAILVAIMAANAIWNLVFFRHRNLRLSFLFFPAYLPLVGILLWQLFALDTRAATALAVYAAYLPYGGIWNYRLWRLNEAGAAPHAAEP